MTTSVEEKPVVQAKTSPSFTVELGDDFGRNIHIPILGDTFRGNWSQARLAVRKMKRHDGSVVEIGGRSLGDRMSRMPEVPGIRLKLEPRSGKVTIIDPYHDDPQALELAGKRLDEAQGFSIPQKYGAPPPQVRELDADQMKTLCRFVRYLVENGSAAVVDGMIPRQKEIDDFLGDYLYDPGNTNTDDRPKYEKDVKEWRQRMARLP